MAHKRTEYHYDKPFERNLALKPDGSSSSLFDCVDLDQVKKLVLAGHTDAFVAHFLNVSLRTFRAWEKVYPQYGELIQSWRDLVDDTVVTSLLKLCNGASVKETKVFCDSDGKITTKEINKNYVPDHKSISLWLRNRKRDDWKDIKDQSVKTDLNVSGKLDVGQDLLNERIQSASGEEDFLQ